MRTGEAQGSQESSVPFSFWEISPNPSERRSNEVLERFWNETERWNYLVLSRSSRLERFQTTERFRNCFGSFWNESELVLELFLAEIISGSRTLSYPHDVDGPGSQPGFFIGNVRSQCRDIIDGQFPAFFVEIATPYCRSIREQSHRIKPRDTP